MSEVHESTDSIVLTPGERKSISFGGEKATFLISGQDTGGLFAIVEQTLGPGMLYGPLHVHQVEDSFLYVLEGELGVQRGEVVVNVTAESLVALPKGLAHIFWNRGARPARFLEIFWPAGLERYFENIAELLQAQADVGAVIECAQKYGLQMRMESVPELMHKYGVKLLGT